MVLMLAILAALGAVSSGDTDHHATLAARATGKAPPPPPLSVGGGRPAHIAVVVMENEEYGSVLGSGQAPFVTALARRYALAAAMYATSHPSLPNYLAMTAGSTFGVSSDCTNCGVNASNLASQLQSARISWKAYMEGLPRPCYTGASAGDYAKKHDPFAYFRGVIDNPAACRRIVPLSQLAVDERSGTLPRFVWITPNLCHDMHDCSVSRGDHFLAGLIPPLLAALGRDGLLFLTWDEGSSEAGCCTVAGGGHIAMIVGGPGARPGARLRSPADQYSLLQTIEDLLGLRRLRYAACGCTPSLGPLLAGT